MSKTKPISENSYILLTVIEGFWTKDADIFGKQDPFIVIKHHGV